MLEILTLGILSCDGLLGCDANTYKGLFGKIIIVNACLADTTKIYGIYSRFGALLLEYYLSAEIYTKLKLKLNCHCTS